MDMQLDARTAGFTQGAVEHMEEESQGFFGALSKAMGFANLPSCRCSLETLVEEIPPEEHPPHQLEALRLHGRAWHTEPGILAEVTLMYSWDEVCLATADFSRLRRLGGGRASTVYSGRLTEGIDVAVKVLEGQMASDDGGRFDEEVRFLSRCRHPNVVMLLGYAVGPEGHRQALVYELLPGGSAHTRLHAEWSEPWHWEDRLRTCVEMSRGLSHLHKYRPEVFHRDIKSASILFSASGVAKIADFGLACASRTRDERFSKVAVTGGTPGYAAPEYADTSIATEASDVYSAGMVLLEFLTGRLPAKQCNDGSDRWKFLLEDICPHEDNANERVLGILDRRACWPLHISSEIAGFALSCIHDEAQQRPNFVRMVVTLNKLLPPPKPAKPKEQESKAVRTAPSPNAPADERKVRKDKKEKRVKKDKNKEKVAEGEASCESPVRKAANAAVAASHAAAAKATAAAAIAEQTAISAVSSSVHQVHLAAPAGPAAPTPTPAPSPSLAEAPAPWRSPEHDVLDTVNAILATPPASAVAPSPAESFLAQTPLPLLPCTEDRSDYEAGGVDGAGKHGVSAASPASEARGGWFRGLRSALAARSRTSEMSDGASSEALPSGPPATELGANSAARALDEELERLDTGELGDADDSHTAGVEGPGWLSGGLQVLRRNVAAGVSAVRQQASPEPAGSPLGSPGAAGEGAQAEGRAWLQPIRGLGGLIAGAGRKGDAPNAEDVAAAHMVASFTGGSTEEGVAAADARAGGDSLFHTPAPASEKPAFTPDIESMGRLFHISELNLDD